MLTPKPGIATPRFPCHPERSEGSARRTQRSFAAHQLTGTILAVHIHQEKSSFRSIEPAPDLLSVILIMLIGIVRDRRDKRVTRPGLSPCKAMRSVQILFAISLSEQVHLMKKLLMSRTH